MPAPDTPIERLKNIGPKTAAWLHVAGIHTFADLETAGALLAYKIVQHQQQGVNLLLLLALEGALHDRHWNSFTPEEKQRLRAAASDPLDIRYGT